MKRVVMLSMAGLLAAALPVSAQPKAGDKPAARLEAVAQQIAADIREAQALLPKTNTKSGREKLELVLTRLELRSTELQKELAAMSKTGKPQAITSEQLALILKGIKAEPFDSGRLSFVDGLGKSRRYTSSQVKTILKEFVSDDDRVKAAVLLFPQVIDPDNFLVVYDVFTFDSGRASLREKLKGKQ
jgi:hypothetical protein